MTDEQILELIKAALADVVPDRKSDFANLALSQSIDELSLDSIATMEMVGFLEDKLQTTFPDEELPLVNTFADIASLMRSGRVGK
jgi:acyl carrier protein